MAFYSGKSTSEPRLAEKWLNAGRGQAASRCPAFLPNKAKSGVSDFVSMVWLVFSERGMRMD
jgi:hypothetical protein